MPKLTTKDKIEKCSKKLKISGKALGLLTVFVDDSKNAIVDDYSLSRKYYTDRIFKGDNVEYLKALKELEENNLIYYNTVQDKMIVQVLHQYRLNNLLYGFKTKTKKYIREPIKQQQGIMSILTSGKLGQIVKTSLINVAKNVPEIEFKYKDRGFKVLESIMPYFTGQPLTDKDRESLLRYNPEFLTLEEKRRNMPKHSILAYCACLTFMDDDGIIDDCTEYSLLQNVWKEFGEDIFCTQTWYNSIQKLLELKLIEKFYDERKDCPCIRVTNIKESSSDRYVIVPFVVFEKDFKKVEIAGLKIFFDIIFWLNNGEEKGGDGTIRVVGQGKTYFFKMAKLDAEKQENREKFEKKLLQYKKRYPNELKIAMFGDVAKPDPEVKKPKEMELKESEFKALAKYFHFAYTSGTALMTRIRKEYYISKQSEKVKKQLSMQSRHNRKVYLLEDLLKSHRIEYQQQDISDLIQVFRRVNRRTVALVVSILAERVRLWKEHEWSKIKSLGAYARKVLQEHRQGTLDPERFTVPHEG